MNLKLEVIIIPVSDVDLWVDCSSVNPSFSRKMAAEAARHRNFGTKIEVSSCLDLSDKIVNNPPDSLVSGQVVRVSSAASQLAKK